MRESRTLNRNPRIPASRVTNHESRITFHERSQSLHLQLYRVRTSAIRVTRLNSEHARLVRHFSRYTSGEGDVATVNRAQSGVVREQDHTRLDRHAGHRQLEYSTACFYLAARQARDQRSVLYGQRNRVRRIAVGVELYKRKLGCARKERARND